MPEIGEIARIVHFLRKHLTNRTIATVEALDDPIVFGKVGTSGAAVSAALKGKTIVDARQQGKYFWLVLNKPPHVLMHFGMTGWIKFSNDDTAEYGAKSKAGKSSEDVWPPKFWKFIMKMQGEPKCEVAFVDGRRLGRVRLVDVDASEMRNTTPLKENGPDPVIDKHILTEEWLVKKMRSKKVPVKALLLDQANISGVGNWVADEVLYNAKIHPEQYSNTLSDAQLKQLHKSLDYVCTLACETLAESDQFPADWLMKHRWGKGKKEQNTLPNGAKIIFMTVGGRTSAVVPSVQKKTGPVAADIPDEEEEDGSDEEQPKSKTKEATKSKVQPNGEVKKEGNTSSPKKRKAEKDEPDTNGAEKKTKVKKEKEVKAETPTRRSNRSR